MRYRRNVAKGIQRASRAHVSSFVYGRAHGYGRPRSASTETTGEAVRIETTVDQAELQERRNDSYLDSGAETMPAVKVQERPGKHDNAGSDSTQSKPPRQVRTRNSSDQQPIQKARSDVHVKCYECSG